MFVDYVFWLVLIVCLVCFCFFFFKQKTVYEMRISDWSSDVCSSDLLLTFAVSVLHLPDRMIVEALIVVVLTHLSVFVDLLLIGPFLADEIGRASCRERVCQYV